MKSTFSLVGAGYVSRSLNVDAQRCVNLYAETNADKGVIALYGTPGLDLLCAPLNAPVRGLNVMGEYLYAVIGNSLFKIDSAWSYSNLGSVGGSGVVSMANNGTQILIVNGSEGYLWDGVTLSVQATMPSNPELCDFQDGYFIVNRGGTQQFYISGLYDGTSWDALDFASSEATPDALVSLIVDHRELWLFGKTSTEIWYNSGASDFPFARVQGAFLEVGCVAPYSVAKADNSVFWLGRDVAGSGSVYRANGYTPQRISTHSIEHAINGYATISDAKGYTYQQEGHTFYVLTFPSASKTWVMDASTGLWHERAYWNGAFERHRGNCYAYFNGKHVVGDYENGNLYAFNLDTYTDNGNPIRALRSCQTIQSDLRSQYFRSLQVDIESGVGLTSGQGVDPQIMLRWSNDGGHRWSNEHWVTMGKLGQYSSRAKWTRLGSGRERVFEVSITDPVKRVLIAATLDMDAGT